MNGNSIRVSLLTAAALLTLGAVMITADRGATAGQTLDEACAGAVWPTIPAHCFGRYDDRDAYPETFVVAAAQLSSASDQNAIGASGKTDLFQSAEIGVAEYRTVETRGDGISVLMRVKVE